ncbi:MULTISPECIES: hypothetical protein [unclassified Variovorax]|uniref:hypothetical protein n=1 Tax=unclassified Variovorax TaxID=663243 RepID=UPI0011AEF4B6|nr:MULTISPECIES: hypothetical protein [unclassified Variovorax]
MKQKIAALIACGLVAGALTSTGALAKDKDADQPLKVVDAAGHFVGRLYGNAKGDFVVIRFGNALGSLRLVEDGPYLMPSESTVFSAAPHCAGSWVIPAGGSVPGTGLPSMPAIGSVKGADQRFTLYIPTSSTVHRITIYSQGQYGGPCNQFNPIPLYGVPAEAASLDSYFVLPFHIE